MSLEHTFLVDGVGAGLSALLLGVVLPAVRPWIGLPVRLLYLLAAISALLALNALFARRWGGPQATGWLRLIMFANVLYCVLTAALVLLHFEDLTTLGVAYFGGEIAIILGLVIVEWQALTKRDPRDDNGGPLQQPDPEERQ